jgi:phage baseplate assembly protein V
VSAIQGLPRLTVEADGSPVSSSIERALAEVLVRQQLSVPALCELTFRDPPSEAAERFTPGTRLRLLTRDASVPLFEGEVTACEHVYEPERGRELRVRGYDLLHRLRKQQRLSAYAEVTVSDLARELAGEAGLSVDAMDSGPFFTHLIQHQQSDFDLLASLAGQCGLYLSVRDGVLHLLTLNGLGSPIELRLWRNLLEAQIDVNGDSACRDVEASGWSALRGETHTGTTDTARVGRDVRAEVPPSEVGGSGRVNLLDLPSAAESQAQAFAQAELDWRVAHEVTLWGVAEGDPQLRPGAIVDVQGVNENLTGHYVLTSATHTIDVERGYLTELTSDPPPPRPRSRSTIMTPGFVTRVDDPEGLARVRVTLPTFGGVETDWMGVLTVAAGSGKGLVALPDVNDNVLVLCAQGDPAHGVVLGGLYGMAGVPDAGGVSGGAVRRYALLTPGGQKVTLDDEGSRLRVENDAGSFVELAPGEVRLHSATDLLIEAPGQALVIQAASIDFRSA